jgi:maleylpyruvate isomerase
MKLRLFHYWRSSSSWRVRWALDHLGFPYEPIPISLLDDSTDRPEFRAINPAGFVPALEIQGSSWIRDCLLTESLPIIETLCEIKASSSSHSLVNSLIPNDPWERAHARRLAEIINAGTQPLANLNVLDLISQEPEARKTWSRLWVNNGLRTFEAQLSQSQGRYCVGDQVTIADLCLVPQLYNARRIELDLSPYPHCLKIESELRQLPEYTSSHPDRFEPK